MKINTDFLNENAPLKKDSIWDKAGRFVYEKTQNKVVENLDMYDLLKCLVELTMDQPAGHHGLVIAQKMEKKAEYQVNVILLNRDYEPMYKAKSVYYGRTIHSRLLSKEVLENLGEDNTFIIDRP